MYLTHCSLSTNSIFKPQLIQIVQIVKFKVTKTFMSKMRNLALLMDPCEEAYDTSLKAANMYMNRFCIDEDASFELSGVNYFQKSSDEMTYKESLEFKFKRKMKGKKCSIVKRTVTSDFGANAQMPTTKNIKRQMVSVGDPISQKNSTSASTRDRIPSKTK